MDIEKRILQTVKACGPLAPHIHLLSVLFLGLFSLVADHRAGEAEARIGAAEHANCEKRKGERLKLKQKTKNNQREDEMWRKETETSNYRVDVTTTTRRDLF